MVGIPRFRFDNKNWPGFYHENGFCILTGMWNLGSCDELVSAAHRFSSPQAGNFKPLLQPQETDTRFLEALRNPKVTGTIEYLIGGQASGLQIEFFFGHPGTTGFSPHQDNFFVEGGSNNFMSAWTAFTDIEAEMGVLFAFPGSHRFGLLPVRRIEQRSAVHQDVNAANEATVLPHGVSTEPVAIIVNKGETVLLHGDLVHGSYDNRSDRFRYALLCTYIRKGTPFREGKTAKRKAIELHPIT